MTSVVDRDFCAHCGNIFPAGQVCDACQRESETLRRAAEILRSRVPRLTFSMRILIRVLHRAADWLDKQ